MIAPGLSGHIRVELDPSVDDVVVLVAFPPDDEDGMAVRVVLSEDQAREVARQLVALAAPLPESMGGPKR